MRKKNPLPFGMAVGMALGTIVGFATDNIGVWLCIGLAIGGGVGNSLKKKENNTAQQDSAD